MQSFSKLRIVSLGIILLIAFFSFSCSKEKSEEVKIGVIVPLTGAAADFGKWAQNGVELAVTESNNDSGASKKRYRAIYADNQMDPKVALSAFKKLVEVDHVSGVITSGSGVVLSIAPAAERGRTVQLNHAAVSPAIRKAGEYTFTLVNDANVETDEIAGLVYRELGVKQIAVLYANAAYGVGTKDALIRSFTQLGGEVMGTVAFPEDFMDARAQLLQLQEMNPPAVYFIATIKDSGRLLKQARELGFKTQWLTYNAFESSEILKIAGMAAEGVIYTSSNLFDLPNPQPEPKQFLDSYLSKYGERPNLYAATAYDAMRLFTLAGASTDGSKEGIQRFLASVANYHGASGIITFDQDGSVQKPVFLKTVRNGQFVLYTHEKGE